MTFILIHKCNVISIKIPTFKKISYSEVHMVNESNKKSQEKKEKKTKRSKNRGEKKVARRDSYPPTTAYQKVSVIQQHSTG